MQIDLQAVYAEVYAKNEAKGRYYVKVIFPNLNMYINSITVSPSTRYDDLWFQMPAFFMGGRWVKPIEFSAASEFHDFIRDTVMRAVDAYRLDEKKVNDEAINLDDIQF